MKQYIRVCSLILSVLLVVCCAACGNTADPTDDTGTTTIVITDGTTDNEGTTMAQTGDAISDESGATVSGQTSTAGKDNGTTVSEKTTTVGKDSGTQKTTTGKLIATTATTKASSDKTEMTVDNMLLCPHDISGISKSILRESVAYYNTDGDMVDFMFDSFAFTLTSNSFYDYESGNPLKQMGKADWAPYMEAELKSVANLDALLTDAKEELNRPNYKAGVALVILPLNTKVTNWGTIDGKVMDLSNTEDCKKVLKWQIEEKIRTFKARKFRNVELVGFYVINEDVHTADLRQFTVHSNRVIHDNGLKAYWAPFHDETNKPWLEWRQLGFDECALQANYFSRNCNNCWKIERLDTTVRYVKQYGVGVEPEMLEETYNAATFFKRYLKKYAENGVMESFKAWYVTGSSKGVTWLAKNRDPYIRSTYDEMYKFIKKTLDPETVQIDSKVSEVPEGLFG